MCHDWSYYSSYQKIIPPKPIWIADDRVIDTVSIGDICIQTHQGRHTNSGLIKGVLHLPKLCMSLLSTTKLANARVGTKSSPQHLDLINIRTGRLMDRAHWVQNLYKLQVDIIHSNELHLTQTHPPAKVPLALWHRQLGHTSEDTILKMVKAEAITGIALNGSGSQNCSACRKGKQMQSIILQVTQERSTKVLGRVFSNICGPIETTSIEGYRYFITFTDDFSRYTHVGLCKSKDDALNIFKMWKACMEKETGQTLKVLHTDGSGKYTSNAFSTYLAEHGIKRELTNAYTPQENSVSEWANWTQQPCVIHDCRCKRGPTG